MRSLAWASWCYVAVGALLIFAYLADPHVAGLPVWAWRFSLDLLISSAAAVALVVGIHRWRPEHVLPWLLLTVSQAVYVGGDFVYYWGRYVSHVDRFPGLADVFYLGRIPFIVLGLALILRRRSGADRPAVIDSLIVAIGAGILSWVFLMQPYTVEALGLSVRLTSLAYPVTDLMLVVMALRLLTGGGRRNASFHLLTGGLVLLVVTDSIYGWCNLHGIAFDSGSLVEAGWLTYYVTVGACALHPSMRGLASPVPREKLTHSRARLAALGVATLVGPVLLISETLLKRPLNVVPIAVASICIIGLVIFRMAGVMKSQEQAEAQIRHQALHDPLTKLPNRALIMDRTEQMLLRAERQSMSVGLLFVDLDNFKDVNDSFGHAVGDQLLQAVAARLTSAVRGADTVGRLGGDEFVVLVEKDGLDGGPELVAERLLTVLSEPFHLLGLEPIELEVHASIGVAAGLRDSPDELVRDADLALYQAKTLGKNRYVVFHSEMQAAAHDHRVLDTGLRRAMERDELFVMYQPTFDLSDMSLTGVEALLRWQHPVRGLVPPDVFIPIAEENGLILPIGRFVLQRACAQGAEWYAAGFPISVAVNVSARQLDSEDFVDDVKVALATSGLAAGSLTLEITESVLMRDVNVVRGRLCALKEIGVRIAIDDFGTGYSSLAYLRQLPVDAIKIDRSFVTHIGESEASAPLIHTLVQLGKALHLETLAEGIENTDQLAGLRSEECDSGQGFLFSRPLDPQAVVDFFLDRKTRHPAGAKRDEPEAVSVA